ncbi:50S ribosomal protein L6 [Candidatus Pacearchaeota archaeon]|nr:50S ribosomal protein L6 [Candidatus Pacearchaeota archaeon]
MKRKISKEITIPEGVQIESSGSTITVKGKEGELKRKFGSKNIIFRKENSKFFIECKKATKNEKKRINTINAHVKNMIKGVQEGFEYKLKICSSHFPMTVEVKGRDISVKNFLGEKIPRVSKLPEGADIEIKGDVITVKALDKELAGQTAAAIERITKIREKDRRVFQDGIFIVEKGGVKI